MLPTSVSHCRSPEPLRWPVRRTGRSWQSTPGCRVTSRSISAWLRTRTPGAGSQQPVPGAPGAAAPPRPYPTRRPSCEYDSAGVEWEFRSLSDHAPGVGHCVLRLLVVSHPEVNHKGAVAVSPLFYTLSGVYILPGTLSALRGGRVLLSKSGAGNCGHQVSVAVVAGNPPPHRTCKSGAGGR
jgi:hypothetical protein